MQRFTLRGMPQSLRRDGWWLSPPETKPSACPKETRSAPVSLFRGYRNDAVARNLAADDAAPAKGHLS